MVRKLYDMVNNTLDNIDFNKIWYGFNKTKFALYNKKEVYLEKDIISYDDRFVGNTTIEYNGENLAIWFVEDIGEIDYQELSANIVHEMFHSYQLLKNESRFPDDIKGLSYPNILENYQFKYNENIMLVEALESKERNEKLELLLKIITSRKSRLTNFGELIRYEFLVETIEGSAEYCAIKALKSIPNYLYKSRIEKYKEILVSEQKIFFDIRKSCYFTGSLLLILLDEVGIEFCKDISNQKLTIFEQILEIVDTNNIIITCPTRKMINIGFKEELLRKQKLIYDFKNNNPIIYKGDFSICGYDPMNMFKVKNEVFCSHFIILYNMKTKEKIFIPGPTIVVFKDNSQIIEGYYVIRQNIK